jgi:hypothetical protein
VLPTDVIHDAPRVVLYTEEDAKEGREDDVDLLEEAREITLSRTVVYLLGIYQIGIPAT